MKLVALLPIVALIGCAYAKNEYDFNLFQRQIDEKCLGRWWTKEQAPNDMKPIGMTLESFLAMVEKVEGSHTDWDMYRVTKELLKRFAFEEIIFSHIAKERRPVQTSSYKHRWDIISKLLPEDEFEDSFREDELSEEEKCTMFFMMGHLINGTYRSQELDGESFIQDVPQEAHFPADTPLLRTKRAQFAREQGVISVDGNRHQAIAISKVLNAIIAGRSDSEQTIGNLVPDVGNKDFPKDMRIKPDIGVTIGDVVSLAALRNEVGLQGYFGPGGDWNHTGCPTEFKLRGNATGATNALLRGAIDGLLITRAIRTWSDIRGLKLSRVLRTYYSPKGFPMAHGIGQEVSYCRRNKLGEIGMNDIKLSVLAFYYMINWKEHSFVDENAAEKINTAIDHMNAALQTMDQDSETDECRMNSVVQPDRPVCETPSNVFVVIDSSEEKTDGFQQQQLMIGELASKVHFGHGSLSVFLDRASQQELQKVAYNESNPTCAGCRIAWIEEKDVNNRGENEIAVLDALNKTLKNFEESTNLLPGVPNKVAVIFRYNKLKEDKKKIANVANILKTGHRDTKILVVGTNRDELSVMTRHVDDVITESDTNLAVQRLQKKICKAPAIFQFNRCWDSKRTTRKEEENNYIGYVTDNHVQFWAFHPEYYLKSYTIHVKFQVEGSGGDITVCEQRGVENPGFNLDGHFDEKKCKKTDSSNRELVFEFKDPCDSYDVHNCPTMNFAIIGRSSSSSQTIGCEDKDDVKCRRLDQIRFKVIHNGISCSGCEFLKSSSLLLGVAALFFMIKNAL